MIRAAIVVYASVRNFMDNETALSLAQVKSEIFRQIIHLMLHSRQTGLSVLALQLFANRERSFFVVLSHPLHGPLDAHEPFVVGSVTAHAFNIDLAGGNQPHVCISKSVKTAEPEFPRECGTLLYEVFCAFLGLIVPLGDIVHLVP
jgi:hypothetical protein